MNRNVLTDHWPYCGRTTYRGGLAGTVELPTILDDPHFAEIWGDKPAVWFREAISLEILRAIRYCVRDHVNSARINGTTGFIRQRVEAESMADLIVLGAYETHEMPAGTRGHAVRVRQAIEDRIADARFASRHPGVVMLPRSIDSRIAGYEDRPTYRCRVGAPLEEVHNPRKLAAIMLIVLDSFENMC